MIYTVNDKHAYGLDAGFCRDDNSFKAAVKSYLIDLHDLDYVLYDDIFLAVYYRLLRDKAIAEKAKEWYRPYPENDGWTAEMKAIYREGVIDKTYPGKCDVPDEIALQWIRSAVDAELNEKAPVITEKCRRTIAKAEKQIDIPSLEVARQREKKYYDLYNEGGYGFVPHVIHSAEYDHAKKLLELMLSINHRRSEES